MSAYRVRVTKSADGNTTLVYEKYNMSTQTWECTPLTTTIDRSGGWPWVAAPTPAIDTSRFPHRCPRCGLAAYITGMGTVEHALDAGCE